MSDTILQWIAHASVIFHNGRGDHLIASIPLDPGHPFFGPLRQGVSKLPPGFFTQANIVNQVSLTREDVRQSYASFLLAVLKYVGGYANEGPIEDFQRLITVCSEANRLYGMSGQEGYYHPFMNPLILQLAKTLIIVSESAAGSSTQPPRSPLSARSIRDRTRQIIEKSFQVSAAAMTEQEWNVSSSQAYSVGDIVWPLSNILFRTFAARKLHTQATDINRILQSLNPPEDRRLAARGAVVRQTDLCASYYWRGRIGVVLLDFRVARGWLQKAWDICPEQAWKQRRAILIKLIPVNILLGRLPSMTLLQTYNLPEFLPLLTAFRTGNIPAWRRELDINREWYRRRSIWLLLYERGEILVWRNLLRNCLKAYWVVNPGAPRKSCPTWVFIEGVRKSFEGSGEVEEGDVGLEDIIVVLASLVDHSVVVGNFSWSGASFGWPMRERTDGFGGFPLLTNVQPRAIQANT